MSNYGSGSGGTPPGPGDNQGGYQPGAQGQPIEQPGMPARGYAPPQGQPGPMGAPQPSPQPPQYGPPPGYQPPPGGPQMGMVGAPPRRKRSPLLIIGGILLVLLVICGGGIAVLVGGVLNATQPIANVGDAYMTALRDGDYAKAFSLSDPSLQQEVKDAGGLQTALGSKQVATWSLTSRNISNNQGSLSGTTTYKTGESGTVDIALTQVGNDWKVAGISLK